MDVQEGCFAGLLRLLGIMTLVLVALVVLL
jgi:hypothetical protein